jgi:ferredoxin-NADP reductase
LVTGDWHVGTVATARSETSNGRVITIDVPGWRGNIAGQHVDVRLTAEDGYQAVRSYSLASFGPEHHIEIAVDEIADGEVSPYLVEDMMVGDELELRGPLGGWFVWEPSQTDTVLLIGGGSGIVPLLAMIRSHAASGSTAFFHLVYSVRSAADAFYADEIASLAGDNFQVTWVYTRVAPADWPEPTGRITKSVLEKVGPAASLSPAVFVCGPTGFVEAVANALVDLGHSPDRIKTERFGGA